MWEFKSDYCYYGFWCLFLRKLQTENWLNYFWINSDFYLFQVSTRPAHAAAYRRAHFAVALTILVCNLLNIRFYFIVVFYQFCWFSRVHFLFNYTFLGSNSNRNTFYFVERNIFWIPKNIQNCQSKIFHVSIYQRIKR